MISVVNIFSDIKDTTIALTTHNYPLVMDTLREDIPCHGNLKSQIELEYSIYQFILIIINRMTYARAKVLTGYFFFR